MHTIWNSCKPGTHFDSQELLCWVVQQQNLIRMEVYVFSDSTMCVGVSNPDPPTNWATKLQDVWNEHGFVDKFIWHVVPRASAIQNQEAFKNTWTGKLQNLSMRGSYACLCSTTLDGQRKAKQKLVCTMPQKWQQLRPNSSQDTGASWSSRQKIRGGKQLPTKLKDNGILSHTSHPIFPATEPLSHGQLNNGWRNYFFQGKVKTMMASNLWCIFNRIWPRRAEAGEQIDLDPEHLTLTAENSETRHKLEATRCYNSQRITKCWFRRASEQAAFAWTVENIEFFTSESVIDDKKFYSCMQRLLRTNKILKVRDYKQFLTVMSRSDQWLE